MAWLGRNFLPSLPMEQLNVENSALSLRVESSTATVHLRKAEIRSATVLMRARGGETDDGSLSFITIAVFNYSPEQRANHNGQQSGT